MRLIKYVLQEETSHVLLISITLIVTVQSRKVRFQNLSIPSLILENQFLILSIPIKTVTKF